MGKAVPNAFTLIELLVVIAIMAVVGTYALSNYGSFGEDQKLKNAVLDIQSLLRQAQTSATANAVCNSLSGATWQVVYFDKSTIRLLCQEPPSSVFIKKTITLGANVEIQGVSGLPVLSCPESVPFSTTTQISFAPVTGGISFIDSGNYDRCTSLTITVQNSKTQSTKTLTIEKGGRIYEQ